MDVNWVRYFFETFELKFQAFTRFYHEKIPKPCLNIEFNCIYLFPSILLIGGCFLLQNGDLATKIWKYEKKRSKTEGSMKFKGN